MISSIIMENVASYKEQAILKTDKKINLIYGLNGSGKSTLSEYLRTGVGSNNDKYTGCSITPQLQTDEQILVYNQEWVKSIFYTNPTLKGIFSLSQGNASAKKMIDEATDKKNELQKNKDEKEAEKKKIQEDFQKKRTSVVDSLWEVKTQYTGGERLTGRFFSGLRGNKESLFSHVLEISKPASIPEKNIEIIRRELSVLLDKNISKHATFNKVSVIDLTENERTLMKKEITGSKNSTFSTLMDQLKNSDWVNEGLKYVEAQKEPAKCPFCQQTINKEHLLAEIKACFDRSYENDIRNLQSLASRYESEINSVVEFSSFEQEPLLEEFAAQYKISFLNLKKVLTDNLSAIKEKLKTPSKPVTLKSVSNELNSLNDVIKNVNNKINEFNAKIDTKDSALEELEDLFWKNIRLQYDVLISKYQNDKKQYDQDLNTVEGEIKDIADRINEQDLIIIEQSKKVSNIDTAINNIKNQLVDLGIDSFTIEKYEEAEAEAEYKLVRCGETADNIFESLSEGEKMIISFLYFIEECKGKNDAKESDKKRLIVIDDPISSLSHIYVFNIAELIKDVFMKNNLDKWEQVFVLTHNLYFFYELVGQKKFSRNDISPEEEKKIPNLYRIVKSTKGASFVKMKANEIQNEYQMYWSVVNNQDHQPALIANCMRNIIDYFFGFIEKRALNEVFSKPEFKNNKFKAFNRYINRESHSDNTNIYDMKEFDYDAFHEAFEQVFKLAGYEEHYKKMSKLGV